MVVTEEHRARGALDDAPDLFVSAIGARREIAEERSAELVGRIDRPHRLQSAPEAGDSEEQKRAVQRAEAGRPRARKTRGRGTSETTLTNGAGAIFRVGRGEASGIVGRLTPES